MRFSRLVPLAIGLSLVLVTGVADATSTTCTGSTVCAQFIDTSSGVAIHGEANAGIGIRGTSNTSTGFYGASRSGTTFFPGVEGETLQQTGKDVAGGFGLTGATGGAAPTYGVLAYGSTYGAYADTTGPGNGTASVPTSIGVVGVDPGGAAGADTNVGIYGNTGHGTAVLGLANGATTVPNNSTYFALQPIGIYADAEPDVTNGPAIGVEAVSQYWALDAYNPASGAELELATSADLMYGASGNFVVDTVGDITATSLTTSKGTYVRTTGSSGAARMSYPSRSTMPVMEDFGEAQLVNGRGYVKLDPALSDVIDNRNAYHVFLTPEGDSNGLYVTQKSPAGFAVRESRGGRSTLAFEYRILAKPVDDNAKRLALAPPLQQPAGERRRLRSGRGVTPQQLPLDPFARLQAHLGPAAYARELKAARTIESGP